MILNHLNDITESIASGQNVLKVIASESKYLQKEFLNLLKDHQIPLIRYSNMIFRKKYPDARGIVALIEETEILDLDGLLAKLPSQKNIRLLLLDEVGDPQNIGAMIRSCVCFGFHGAILTARNTAPIMEGVIKASSGACFHLPIARVGNLTQGIEELKKHGFWIVGTHTQRGVWLNSFDTDRSIALIMGNEDKGIRPKILNHCDYHVQIPMEKGFDSLNVSVAFGIIAFSLFSFDKKSF